jgi:endonuclease/exonuclease/phosphatase family metal-dependent hydrolase
MPFLLILLPLLSLSSQQTVQLKVLTYNIRLDTPADGENQWPIRKEKVAGLLREQQPDIFGVQEALHNQMQDLEQLLPGYRWYGVGRDDAKTSGEYSALFYRSDKYEVIKSGTFWLSETPGIPGSKSWDAAITRICSWSYFREKASGRSFFVFNTHFDHQGAQARLKSMELIREKIRETAGSSPFVLMGDFNFQPTDAPYALVGDAAQWKVRDSFHAAEVKKTEDVCTFTGFKVEGAECRRIDYIFASEHCRVLSFDIIEQNDGRHFPSDHLPVLAELSF